MIRQGVASNSSLACLIAEGRVCCLRLVLSEAAGLLWEVFNWRAAALSLSLAIIDPIGTESDVPEGIVGKEGISCECVGASEEIELRACGVRGSARVTSSALEFPSLSSILISLADGGSSTKGDMGLDRPASLSLGDTIVAGPSGYSS